MAQVLILGGRSDIGLAFAHICAQNGYEVCLAARRPERLADDVRDIATRYQVHVETREFDAENSAEHADWFNQLGQTPDIVLYAAGYLGDIEQATKDNAELERIMQVNARGAMTILEAAARAMEHRGSGTIIGISSVAGERGRKSNYHYGAAKAALTTFLSGLRNRLAGTGIHVMTVKPGFVATRMLEGMQTPAALTATPERCATDIYRAVQSRRDVVYSTWHWRYVMAVIRNIPERLFKKMSI